MCRAWHNGAEILHTEVKMDQIEMVAKLHEKANISYSDARDALERSNWDMLEALLILEKEGKIKPLTSSAESDADRSDYEVVTATASKKQNGEFKKDAKTLGEKLKELAKKTITYSLIVRRSDKEILSLPVIFLIILIFVSYEAVAAVMLICLFFGCSYSIDFRSDFGSEKNK